MVTASGVERCPQALGRIGGQTHEIGLRVHGIVRFNRVAGAKLEQGFGEHVQYQSWRVDVGHGFCSPGKAIWVLEAVFHVVA